MSYTVLARRYRSRDFDEIVGQEPIARTLQNAIRGDRIAHAYLFCGTRGVGKTSMARIFARALNVSSDLAEADDISDAILRGDDLDVIEIDGASNRGIQEARDLIASAGLSPARCRYRIYIIDEVHMLTREAFNALLKTMEEPPEHVKFILCTTDPQKVPATIQSRCQRFDFRAIPTTLIAGQLHAIVDQEGIDAEEELIIQIARMGQGSMRDALSLLDRVIAATDGLLTLAEAESVLGLPDHELVGDVVRAVIDADPQAALAAGAELIARGATVEQALERLAEHLRGLMLVAACGADSEMLEMSSDAVEAAATQAAHFDLPALVHMIAVCDAASRNARGSATARALFDAALVRLCLSEQLADAASLLQGAEPPAAAAAPAKRVPAVAGGAKKKGEQATRVDAAVEVKTSPPEEVSVRGSGSKVTASSPELVVDEHLWQRVLDSATSPKDESKVRNLRLESFDGRLLRLAIADGATGVKFLMTQSESVRELVHRATGRDVRVVIIPPEETAPTRGASAVEVDVQQLPIVRDAIDIFGASVKRVEDLGTEDDGV